MGTQAYIIVRMREYGSLAFRTVRAQGKRAYFVKETLFLDAEGKSSRDGVHFALNSRVLEIKSPPLVASDGISKSSKYAILSERKESSSRVWM